MIPRRVLAAVLSALATWGCGGKVFVDLPGGTGGGGAGAGGSGGGAGGSPFEAACEVPDDPPSGGACVSLSCNPVTNAGCGVGEACDIGSNGFLCFPSGEAHDVCEPCSNVNGPFCGGGRTCLTDGGCARYCCDDVDCGAGFCDKTVFTGGALGVCKRRP